MSSGRWSITEWVARTRSSRIGHAQHADGADALLKVACADATVFREEYSLLRSLDVPGVARPRELTVEGAAPAMVLDERDVVCLADALDGQPFDVSAALRIGHALAKALGALHAAGIVHGDLRPQNILVDPGLDAAWIVDLSAAIERRRSADDAPPAVEDWAWIAPEQTGRMNRPVDRRADLYVLGLLLYRMLAGRGPFDAADPLEWAHCHAARLPAALPPPVPSVVSDIVLKLLAKSAEHRYRHAEGVVKDIERCLADFDANGGMTPFALGADDPQDELQPPHRLHGREAQQAVLEEAFARTVASGSPQLLLVSGQPGIGKTSLVQVLHEPVAAARGNFVSAKFDSQRRDVPYATLAQALHELVRQVLGRPQEQLAAWRAELAQALGANGQVMVDVVPPLALVIGEQPALPELAPAEAQNRLRWVLGHFVGVFARAEHPLVLFLDDLQWADVATLALLRDLLISDSAGALLVVGAYRDEEVGPAHPLSAMLEQAQARGARVTPLVLAPLEPADVTALISDCLHANAQETQPLAALVRERTEGNPFFILQLLAELRAEGLLTFDVARRAWRWDLDRIRARQLPDNVVHLVTGRLRRLPQSVREVLQHAACLGAEGRVTLLAAAAGTPAEEIDDALAEAARAGLVALGADEYRFLHDRVHEAAYALIAPADRTTMHLRIGRLLLATLAPTARDERVFEIAAQLNRGAPLLTEPAELLQLARLNATAGRKAKAGLAFASAQEHLARAAAAWPADGWQTLRDETFSLQFELAECDFLIARFEDADARLEALLAHAQTKDEHARIYGLRIRVRLVPGRFGAAASAALAALQVFDIHFPDTDAPELVQQERREIERELAGRSIDDLLNAPALQDPQVRTVLGLMVDSFTGIYISQPAVFPRLVLKATQLVLRHGNCEESAVVYTYYARVLLAAYGEIATAYEYSQLALRLNEKLGDRKRRGMLLFSHAGFIHFWSRPFASGRPILDSGFAACLEVGNFVHAALIAVNTCLYMVESGERLDELAVQAERAIAFLRSTHSGGTLEVVQVFAQFVRCLQGRTRSAASFDDDAYDHADLVRRMAAQNNVAGLGIVHMLEQVSAFIAGEPQAALQAAARTQGVLRAVHAMAVRPTHGFYRALALAAACPEMPPSEQADALSAIEEHAADLEGWAAHCPENYATRHALVAAELARLRGQELHAERLYEEAIEAARASGLTHQEAIACEIAAAFHQARGLTRIAQSCRAQAHAAYARWGAAGKVRQLEAQYPTLRNAGAAAVPIDTLAVVKATQAVSGQIDLDALLDTLMRIALEQAGAQAGRLYVTAEDRLELAASAEVLGDSFEVRVHPPGTQAAGDEQAHPTAVLNFVRRSREPVLLSDATQPHRYADDAYLRRRQPRSVLCVPLLRQSQTIGVLYLEHLIVTHAFTSERAVVLGMLAGQAAISIETARLYAALKEENASRRRAEAAALEWQARIGRLVESNIIAVRIGELDGRIVDANEAYLSIVGYTREDMAAGLLTTRAVTPPEYWEADERALDDLVRHGRYTPFEKEYVRKDGTRVPVLAGGILFQGERAQTVGFVLDLSERKRAEADREARFQAEAANQAKSAFLANMSHELRTPLNAVLGYAQLLQRDDNLTARQRKGLSTIKASGEHLLALIVDILDLARIEAGKLELTPEPVVLHRCLNLVADIVRQRADQAGLQFVLDLQPPLPESVHVDERRLRQVLLNLLSNAVKFTRAGSVTLRVRAQAHGHDAWALAFEVQDTGVGMTPEDVQRIFHPFEQAGSAQQRAEGVGLGLAITDALVRQMGGRITVHSEPGRGSCFSFELVLPTASTTLDTASGLSISGYLGPRRRVLVVDDMRENRQVLLELLASLDFHTAEAADGTQALVQATMLKPDLVIVDNRMPGMTGSELTRRLRAGQAFADARIIAVSAGATAEEQARCLAAGANVFLPKPVDVAELLEAIGTMLDLQWTYRTPPA